MNGNPVTQEMGPAVFAALVKARARFRAIPYDKKADYAGRTDPSWTIIVEECPNLDLLQSLLPPFPLVTAPGASGPDRHREQQGREHFLSLEGSPAVVLVRWRWIPRR